MILFLGAPGSGKGTQSSWLAGQLGIARLSTGDMLRAESNRNTPAGRKLRSILASGALVDDQLVCEAVNSRLSRELPGRGIILDGFPRTLQQAESFDRILSQMELPGPFVLHLDVPRDRLMDRLTSRRHCATCGAVFNLASRPSRGGERCEVDGGFLVQRDDDTEAVIQRRLREFDLACAPLVEYYSGADYHRINGDGDTEAVSAALFSVVRRVKARAAA